MNDDGAMARMPDLVAFGQLHRLKIGTIADLIAHRRRTERHVHRTLEAPFESVHGGSCRLVLYRSEIDGAEHVALVHGRIEPGKPTLVRMHQVDFAADLLGQVQGRATHVPEALRQIGANEGAGVMVFLREPGLTGLADRLQGMISPTDRALKAYGIGAQILLDLGVQAMVLLSSTRPEPTALEGYGLQIAGWRSLGGTPS